MSTSIKDLVKGKQVHFSFFRQGVLYYETDDGFLFEVPSTDIGTANMLRDDKAILFMRWIRKQLAANQQGEEDSLKST